MSTSSSRVELNVRILAQTPESLLLDCRLKNALDHTLYAFDRPWHSMLHDGVYWVDPNIVYVELVEHHVASVGKWIPPIPENMSVESPIVPLVTRVEAGKTLHEMWQIPLPLTQFDPYLPKPRNAAAGETEARSSLRVSIGYCDATQLGQLEPQTARTTRGEALRLPMLRSQQHLATTTLHNVSIPVVPDTPQQSPPRRCPNCGATNVGPHTTCLICSATLHAPQPDYTAPGGAGSGSAVRCPNPGCGEPIFPGSKFCPSCGTPAPADRSSVSVPQFCEKCGDPLLPGIRFCPSCGAEVPHGLASQQSSTGPARCPNPQCGATVPAGNTFCSECGTRVG